MEKWKNWWKQDNRLQTLAKALVMACLPLLCCIITCAAQGRTIGEVYLPASEWNDELFYFKQVEGIVNYGFPQGYFGFNESHALKLSFAAWSPVLVFPWILWGMLFGWNLMSPVICNIVLLTAASFAFVWLVKPKWKQLGLLGLLFCLYTPFTRYMLSGMPEIICFSMLIWFYGIAISYLRRPHGSGLVWMFVISGLLTLMRPYMLLFMLLPAFLWICRAKWRGVAGSGVVIGVTAMLYALIKHYLGAEYFAPLFFTDWVTAFWDKGLFGGMWNLFGTLYWKGKDFLQQTLQGFRSGLASGAFFGGYLACMAVLLWQSYADYRKQHRLPAGQKDSQENSPLRAQLVVELHLAVSFIGMLFALLLMYKLVEGSKHLLTFMAAAVFLVSGMRTRSYKKVIFLGALFAYLYSYKAAEHPYDYQIPFTEETLEAQVEDWGEIFARNLELSDRVPSYDNVVIWVFSDRVGDGHVVEKWQLLYGLPQGFGISCCEGDYVTEHLETLQSRYLAVPPDGVLDEMCRETGYRELGRDADLVLYERY